MPLVVGTGGAPNKFVYIHDNVAFNNRYGFNIDSEFNDAVNIQFNWIGNPQQNGIVIGGEQLFHGFNCLYKITYRKRSSINGDLVFRTRDTTVPTPTEL